MAINRKVWADNQVLTASDLNTYLGNQAVVQFTSSESELNSIPSEVKVAWFNGNLYGRNSAGTWSVIGFDKFDANVPRGSVTAGTNNGLAAGTYVVGNFSGSGATNVTLASDRITINTSGLYTVHGTCVMSSSNAHTSNIRIAGSVFLDGTQSVSPGGGTVRNLVTGTMAIQSGQYVQLEVNNNNTHNFLAANLQVRRIG